MPKELFPFSSFYMPLITGCLVGVLGIYPLHYVLSPLTGFPMLPSCIYLGICEQQILINILHVGRGKPIERSQPCYFPSEGMAWQPLLQRTSWGSTRTQYFRESQRKSHRDDGRVSFYLLKIQPFMWLGFPQALQDSLLVIRGLAAVWGGSHLNSFQRFLCPPCHK